jgi:hypothetical protein
LLQKHGAIAEHRRSFKPVQRVLGECWVCRQLVNRLPLFI